MIVLAHWLVVLVRDPLRLIVFASVNGRLVVLLVFGNHIHWPIPSVLLKIVRRILLYTYHLPLVPRCQTSLRIIIVLTVPNNLRVINILIDYSPGFLIVIQWVLFLLFPLHLHQPIHELSLLGVIELLKLMFLILVYLLAIKAAEQLSLPITPGKSRSITPFDKTLLLHTHGQDLLHVELVFLFFVLVEVEPEVVPLWVLLVTQGAEQLHVDGDWV